MFDITELIYKVPNFLSDNECELLINTYEEGANQSESESSSDSNSGIVTTSTFKKIVLNPDTDTESYNLIFRKTEEAVNEYLKYLNEFESFHIPEMKRAFLYSHDYRLLKYEVGAKIHPHSDHEPYTYGSITFNLNDDYTGGEFKFFNGKHTVKLNKGDMMIWPADYFWVHEVTPVETGVRYSANSFLICIPSEIRNLLSANLGHLTETYYRENKISLPKSYKIKD